MDSTRQGSEAGPLRLTGPRLWSTHTRGNRACDNFPIRLNYCALAVGNPALREDTEYRLSLPPLTNVAPSIVAFGVVINTLPLVA